MSKNAFALSLDKTATVIQHIVEERNKPGFDLLCKVFEVYPNVSKDWLMEGRGAMYGTAQQPLPTAPAPVPPLTNEPAAEAKTAAPPAAPHQFLAPVAPPAAVEAEGAAAESAPESATAETSAAGSMAEAPAAPASVPAAQPAAAPASATAPNWEAALYAQQLQHQLALAEMRNQHLLEQQKMLQQMVELLRQK